MRKILDLCQTILVSEISKMFALEIALFEHFLHLFQIGKIKVGCLSWARNEHFIVNAESFSTSFCKDGFEIF